MKHPDIERVLREVRRMRGEARAVVDPEIRRNLKAAAAKLEQVAQRVAREGTARKTKPRRPAPKPKRAHRRKRRSNR